MITFIISAFKIIFLLGFLITIHETGHFIVAKLCKVKVNEFAIGFGPTIWKKETSETKYAIRLIPLGGFVSMEGEEEHSEKEGSFSNASIPKRIAIVIAGAMVNIIFALIVYFGLATSNGNNITTVVDKVIEDYPAQEVGIVSGDEIKKINDKNVYISSDITEILNNSKNEELTVTVKRNNEIKEIKIKPKEVMYKTTGIYLYQPSQKSTKIADVENNSVAQKAGLEAGDTIIKINNEDVEENPEKLISILAKQDYDELELEVKRRGNNINIEIIPEEKYQYYLGVNFKVADNNFINNMYYASINTKYFVVSIGENLKQFITGKSTASQLIGPVGISEVVAKTQGIKDFIYMLAIISMSLGVTNLIPFPPLDGGKILFLIIEAIRRKPLKQETEIKIQLIGFSVLIVVSLYVTYNDVLRII